MMLTAARRAFCIGLVCTKPAETINNASINELMEFIVTASLEKDYNDSPSAPTRNDRGYMYYAQGGYAFQGTATRLRKTGM